MRKQNTLLLSILSLAADIHAAPSASVLTARDDVKGATCQGSFGNTGTLFCCELGPSNDLSLDHVALVDDWGCNPISEDIIKRAYSDKDFKPFIAACPQGAKERVEKAITKGNPWPEIPLGCCQADEGHSQSRYCVTQKDERKKDKPPVQTITVKFNGKEVKLK